LLVGAKIDFEIRRENLDIYLRSLGGPISRFFLVSLGTRLCTRGKVVSTGEIITRIFLVLVVLFVKIRIFIRLTPPQLIFLVSVLRTSTWMMDSTLSSCIARNLPMLQFGQ
jgi:hypothetical protein